MAKVGRPSKLTPETTEKFLTAIRSGASIQTACDAAGLHHSTVAEWRMIGEGRHPTKKATQQFVEFSESVICAIADSEMILLSRINTASKADWRAASWILERRFSEKWANTQRIQLEVEKRVAAEVDGRVQDEHTKLFESIMGDESIPLEAKRKILEHAVELGEKAAKAELN